MQIGYLFVKAWIDKDSCEKCLESCTVWKTITDPSKNCCSQMATSWYFCDTNTHNCSPSIIKYSGDIFISIILLGQSCQLPYFNNRSYKHCYHSYPESQTEYGCNFLDLMYGFSTRDIASVFVLFHIVRWIPKLCGVFM